MTQPAANAPQHIPGLITTAGSTVPPLPATAQPGGTLPPGTMTSGALPVSHPGQTGIPVPALPQAGGQIVATQQPDPAALAAWQAAQAAQIAAMAIPPAGSWQPAPQAPGVVPTPDITAIPQAPALPVSVPNYAPQQPVAIPGLAAPVALPPAQPAAPAATPPATPATGSATEPNGLDDGDGKPYPEGKPVSEMTAEESGKYYKWYSRQWENRSKAGKTEIEQLRAELLQARAAAPAAPALSEVQQQIAAARNQGYQEAATAAVVTLVDAHVRAGLNPRLQPHQVEELASKLSHTHFLSADGRSVDADKVASFVNTVAPVAAPVTDIPAVPAAMAPAAPAAPGSLPTSVPTHPGQNGQPVTGLPRPDLGQGTQPAAPLDKLTLGRQQAQAFLAGNL